MLDIFKKPIKMTDKDRLIVDSIILENTLRRQQAKKSSSPKAKKLRSPKAKKASSPIAIYKRNVDGPYLKRNIGLSEMLDIADIVKQFPSISIKSRSSSSSIARKSTLKNKK